MHLATSFDKAPDGELGPQPTAVTLTIASGKVASNLTDFVVFVDLADITDVPFWAAVQADGGNLRITDNNNVVIPHDMVEVDQVGETGHIFFKASLLTGSANVFKVQALGTGFKLANDNENGRNAVWSDYKAMWDFEELADRTGNGYNMTLQGDATITDATFPGWLRLDGISDYGRSNEIYPGSGPTDWTLSGTVIYESVATTKHRSIFGLGQFTTTNNSRETATLRNSPNNWAIWNTNDSWQNGSGVPIVGARNRAALWHQGTTARELFIDGVANAVDAGPVSQKPSSTHHYAWLGVEDLTLAEDLFGRLNYVYLREEIMSDDWLLAEFDSWEAPGTFYAIT